VKVFAALAVLFVGLVILANWLAATYIVSVGFGRVAPAGVFCEALAVQIREDVAAALELEPARVTVTLEQKARGGITITARA